MTKPQKPEPGGSIYKAALEKLPPEMREAFVDACITAGLSEDDVAHALILCQARVLDAGLSAHAQGVTAAVQGVVNGVAQRVETIRKERVSADLKQQQLLAASLEEIRRRQTQLATAETQSWQKTALKIGAGAFAGVILTVLVGWNLTEGRVNEVQRTADVRIAALQRFSDERYGQGLLALQLAGQFLVNLHQAGGGVRYTPPEGQPVTAVTLSLGQIRPRRVDWDQNSNQIEISLSTRGTPSPTPKR